ncbi:MAG: dicarboxylate/amino acid:cation symporter, partial [Verrucomicrobiota bacterium]
MTRFLRSVSLTHWIFIAMLGGLLLGWALPAESQHLKVVSNMFLKMIKCILVPLVFGTLVVGIAGHSEDLKSVGRLAWKSILYFEVVTTLALAIGLVAVNVFAPGVGVALPPANAGNNGVTATKVTFGGILEHIVPKSFFEAAAANDVLQVVFFAVFFGIALAQTPEAQRTPMLRFCESLTEVMFKFTGVVMRFAPVGIGAAMAYTVGHSGLGVLANLAKLIGTLYLALAVFAVTVLLPMARGAR